MLNVIAGSDIILFSLSDDPNLGNASYNNSGRLQFPSSLSASLNASNPVSEELMETMDALMQSLSSGDFSSVNPSQFYSLLGTLQGMDGLNRNDLSQLEHSYSQYLKLTASIGSSSLGSFNSNSSGIMIPNNSNGQSLMGPRMSPHISPGVSPMNSPLSCSPQAPGLNMGAAANSVPLNTGGYIVNSQYTGSPVPSPGHSPVGSPVRGRNALLSSGSLTTSNSSTHLVPNRLLVASCSSPQGYTNATMNYTRASPVNVDVQYVHDNSTERQYLNTVSRSDLLLDDDDDEFDWSSIL